MLAQDVFQLRLLPPNAINAYVVGDVLVDAATRHSGRRIMRQLEGREITAHVLTHAHPDHQGASHEICTKLGIPYWVGEADIPAAEDGDMVSRQPKHPAPKISAALFGGPGHSVDRALHESDEVAGFQVLDVPGHSAGHIALWRESDRTLILGDVLNNLNTLTGMPGLHQPPDFFTPDPVRNRESARRLAALEPALVCFGHGAPLRDSKKLVDFVASLPAD